MLTKSNKVDYISYTRDVKCFALSVLRYGVSRWGVLRLALSQLRVTRECLVFGYVIKELNLVLCLL